MSGVDGLPAFHRNEIRSHSGGESVWIVIENHVYDVTKFIEDHPGGADVLIEHAGKDATEAFADVGHSLEAITLREKYLIGILHPDDSSQSWASRVSSEKKKNVKNVDLKEKIIQSDCAVKAAIQDIWRCDGTVEELQSVHEAARRKMNELRGAVEKFETAAREADDIKQKTDMEESAKFFKEQMQNTNSTLRKAFLTKKLALDEAAKSSLLSGAKNSEVRRRQTAEANRENLARTASDITQSLLSISRVMNDSVKQSADSLNTLVRSSGTVKHTNEELKNQSGVIQTSHRLLTKYNRRECTDKFLIFLALAFFFSTVLYILKKRLWPA